MYYGDIRLGDTIDIKFTSRQFSTGAPFTLAGSPAVAAYIDNNTTEITAGITLSVDFDSRTGLNNVRVVASNGNGFATGTNIFLVVTAGTVDGVSVVGETVGSFSIEARSALRPTTAGRTLDVSAAGNAGIDWANIDAPTTTQNLSGTTVKTATDVETDTQDIQSRLPAALVSGRMDSSVGAMAANVLTASALATDAVNEIADGVWDEQLSGHTTAGSAGKALSDAGSAGDPWATALPGAYSAGTAGHIIGTGVPDIAPGAANGLFKAGSNAATSIATALTANIIGNVTGNLSGSVGSVTGNVGGNVVGSVASVTGNVGGNVVGTVASVVGNVGGNVTGSIGSLATQAKADVNAEVVDVLTVDTFAEPTGVPAATVTLASKIGRLYQALRNGLSVTATAKTFNDDSASPLWKKTLNDDGVTYTEGEGTSP